MLDILMQAVQVIGFGILIAFVSAMIGALLLIVTCEIHDLALEARKTRRNKKFIKQIEEYRRDFAPLR